MDKFPERTIDYIQNVIERVGKGELYSEYGWDKKD